VNVLLIGSGGREHALAWRLAQSPSLGELHAAPGNPGIAALGRCHPVHAEDGEGLLALCMELGIQLVVVGPEAPLVAGVADQLRHAGVAVFGPGADAARIEGSKTFAKEILAAARVPFARTLDTPRAPCVVKADGLAAGKGVFVCRTEEELAAGLESAAAFGGPVVVEELLEGEEVSVFAIVSGEEVVPLPAARDHKRIGDGDTGPNTGGMGAFSPVGGVHVGELVDAVHRPVATALARRGTPFVGVLFAGLMLTEEGPKVLEFNARLGDPEAQTILPLLEGDVLESFAAAARGVPGPALTAGDGAAVTLVLAAGSYPGGGDDGSPIDGIADAEEAGALVFHAGTARSGAQLVTHGGRILNVTALGADLGEARDRAYDAAEKISFPDMQYRSDIALEAARV
jgi:phosphoribosylamine--glycine ligase